jgi:hypothetical protein
MHTAPEIYLSRPAAERALWTMTLDGVKADPGALAFPGAKGGPLRRGNFNRSAAWPQAVAAIGGTGPALP